MGLSHMFTSTMLDRLQLHNLSLSTPPEVPGVWKVMLCDYVCK